MLKVIWKDLLWLNSRRPIEKITGLILVVGFIVGGWYLGREWWNEKGDIGKGGGRLVPRWEFWGVVLGIFFVCYVVSVIERGRKRS